MQESLNIVESKKPDTLTRINLGSGRFNLPGFVNVDAVQDKKRGVRPDVQSDILSYMSVQPAESAQEVYCGHVLEHLDKSQCEALLRDIARVLIPGGRLTVTVPDTSKAISLYENDLIDHNTLVGCVLGERINEYEYHNTIFSFNLLVKMAGPYFSQYSPVSFCPYWPANVPWQTAVKFIR